MNLVPALFTFYIQGVLNYKNNSGAKRLIMSENGRWDLTWRLKG